MSDFPSLNDLKSSGNTSTPVRPRAGATTDTIDEALQKKMRSIAAKEHETEAMQLAAKTGYPHINLDKFPVGQQALKQISREDAERLKTVCFYFTQDEFRLGSMDPASTEVQELLFQIGERTHAHGVLYTISDNSLARVLKLYNTLPTVTPITKDVEIHAEDLAKVGESVTDFHSLQDLIKEKSTTDIVTFLLGASLKLDSSDVHIEAEEKGVVARFRIDGILHEAAEIPKEAYKQLVSRIKLISSLKININDQPQDGRFTIKGADGEIDVRVSTIPTVYGESIVMRLLRQNQSMATIEQLGLRPSALAILKHEIERPNGMIITTGPTGSGKTTTMYSVLKVLNQPGEKILTLEDPVEYKLEGINQSQIDMSKGYTFAKGLRSMLRQDPDIVMVGEIRDLETADIAIQAALTGHLMLSTIHTNSASGAIPRFLSMGVKPFLLAPALNSVIGQRLVRKLCEACKTETTLTPELAKQVEAQLALLPKSELAIISGKPQTFYSAPGCDKCNQLGYRGRIGIYEIFIMNPEIEQLILTGQVSEYAIEQIAIKNGMVSMVQDGILKSLDGITSVDEVFRVIE